LGGQIRLGGAIGSGGDEARRQANVGRVGKVTTGVNRVYDGKTQLKQAAMDVTRGG